MVKYFILLGCHVDTDFALGRSHRPNIFFNPFFEVEQRTRSADQQNIFVQMALNFGRKLFNHVNNGFGYSHLLDSNVRGMKQQLWDSETFVIHPDNLARRKV